MEIQSQQITVTTTVNASIEKAWIAFTVPEHITKWNFASDDWHTPKAENDLRPGGQFNYRMEAKDGSFGFDFAGEYNEVDQYKLISYTMGDSRKAKIIFIAKGNQTIVEETFDAESMNPVDMQRNGWQAILNNYKKYVESL